MFGSVPSSSLAYVLAVQACLLSLSTPVVLSILHVLASKLVLLQVYPKPTPEYRALSGSSLPFAALPVLLIFPIPLMRSLSLRPSLAFQAPLPFVRDNVHILR